MIATIPTEFWLAITGLVLITTQLLTSWHNKWQLNKIAATGEKTLTQVNGAMGHQLQIHADLTARVASKSDALPEDVIAANAARKLLDEHKSKQTVVSSNEIKQQRVWSTDPTIR